MEYPYYIVPQVEEYRKLDPASEEAKKLSRLIAANVGDYASLRLILGIDPPEFARFYPDMETSTPTTMDTIDSFLDKFGTNLPDDPLAFGTSMSGYILSDEEESGEGDEEERKESEKDSEGSAEKEDEERGEERLVEIEEAKEKVLEEIEESEANSEIEGEIEFKEEKFEIPEPKMLLGDLLRERRYEEALQFIERENLNNPEKSIYFAHQNRFIKKLMAIEKFRNQNKG